MTFARRVLTCLLLLACAPSLKPQTSPAANHAAAIADARRAWNNDARELADLLRKLAAAAAKGEAAETNLNRERRALSDLEEERRATLADLRNGAFCTGCGATRSQLLARGEPFPHPGQQSRPATPEEIDRAEQGFNGRREVIRRRIAALEAEVKDADDDLLKLHHRYLVLKPVYHNHLFDEQQARLAKWLDEKNTADTALKTLQQAQLAAAGDAAASDKLGEQLKARLTSARLAEDRARQEERLYRKDVIASLDYLAGLAKPIRNRRGVSGQFIAATLRTPPRPVGYTVPGIFLDPAPATAGAAQDPAVSPELQKLLDGPSQPPSSAPKSPAPGEKSVQDLLNGK